MALQRNIKSTAESEPQQNIRPAKDRSSERDVTELTQATICELSNIDGNNMLPHSAMLSRGPACHTWGDLLNQDGGLTGQGEAMRVEAWVSWDLNVEAKRVISLI